MEPQVRLQCLLAVFVVLGACGGRTNDVMECGIGGESIEEVVKIECYNVKDLKSHATWPSKNCELVSCDPNRTLAWRVLDETLGKIEVRLRGSLEKCDYLYYDMDLEVYDAAGGGGGGVDASHECAIGGSPWKTHSKRRVSNDYCPGCPEHSVNCLELYTLIFRYVYPGWYRLKVTPRIADGSTRQSQISHYFRIDRGASRYAKKRLADLNVNITLQYRDAVKQLDVGIPLLVDVPPEVVGFEVRLGQEYLYDVARYGSSNDTTIRCEPSEETGKPSCQVTSSLIECTFYNMTEGDYRIVVRFKDDRCAMSTIWTESILDSEDPCRWDVKREYNADSSPTERSLGRFPTETFADSSPFEVLYSVVAVTVVVVVVVVLAFYLRRRRSDRRRLLAQVDSGSPRAQHYNFGGQPSRFNFGQLLTLTDKPRPEVLLIYTRDAAPFMELVACLRRVLDKICKCQVYDYFDPEQWNDVSQDPEGWIRALIVERQAKVVIVASEVAAIRHRSLMGDFPELSYKAPHPFDNLFPYALRLLRDGADEDSYRNHFVVTFDGFTEAKATLEYFNPYARFVLPKHLGKLFEHLHDSDATVRIDTSSRLEERFEVRQLRLQLEHLINLKLLNQTDAEKQKLYDW